MSLISPEKPDTAVYRSGVYSQVYGLTGMQPYALAADFLAQCILIWIKRWYHFEVFLIVTELCVKKNYSLLFLMQYAVQFGIKICTFTKQQSN